MKLMSYKLISLKVNLKVYFEKTNLKINYLWCSRKKKTMDYKLKLT